MNAPTVCEHRTSVHYNGHSYCGGCGRGMSEGANAYALPENDPGHADRLAARRAQAEDERKVLSAREATYDVSGIYLDWGITALSGDELSRLVAALRSEQRARL